MYHKTKVITVIAVIILISGVFVNTNIFGLSTFAIDDYNEIVETEEESK